VDKGASHKLALFSNKWKKVLTPKTLALFSNKWKKVLTPKTLALFSNKLKKVLVISLHYFIKLLKT
jgi:hypothetical protein